MSDAGGDSSSVAEHLQSAVVSFADPLHDDRLVLMEGLSSEPSTALVLTIDTTAPVITSGEKAIDLANQSGASQLVYMATAIDAAAVSYSLKPHNIDDSSAFSIDPLTGDVLLIENPNYDHQNRYNFTIVATDTAGNTTEQVVLLEIQEPTAQSGIHLELPSQLTTDENGASIELSLILNTQPIADVDLSFSLSENAEAGLSHQDFVFTLKDWNIAQTLIITGQEDFEVDGDQPYAMTIQSSSADPEYQSISRNGQLEDITLDLINLDDNEDAGSDFYGDQGEQLKDTIFGADGPDRIYGERADDVLYGREGSDLIYGGYGDDQLYGDEGDDELYGEKDNDSLYGGSGNDRLTGGEGDDLLIGGHGDDTYIIDDERDTIDDQGLDSDIDTVVFRANLTTYTVPDSIKNARLDSGSAFKLIGNAKANTLIGNDIANDIDGGDGDDSLDGAGGDDTLKGGNGRDAVIYSKQLPGFLLDGSGAQDITVNLLSGTATGSKIGSDSLSAIEDVLTGDGNDHLTGDDQDNRLDAGGGNDTISSGAGNDSIYGRNGDDLIDGGDGSDTAHFTGNFSDYQVTPTSSGFTITDTRAFQDGTNQLSNVELFVFADQTFTPDVSSDVHDIDLDGVVSPFTDGLLITSAAQAIEIAAKTESQPVSFNPNLHDQLINPNGSRNTTDAAKAFIKDAITSGLLDRNNNGVLDLQDAQRILRDGLGTHPGDSATAGLREPPVPAGTTNSELINEQEQLDALDDSLEAIALMAEAGPQFLYNSKEGC